MDFAVFGTGTRTATRAWVRAVAPATTGCGNSGEDHVHLPLTSPGQLGRRAAEPLPVAVARSRPGRGGRIIRRGRARCVIGCERQETSRGASLGGPGHVVRPGRHRGTAVVGRRPPGVRTIAADGGRRPGRPPRSQPPGSRSARRPAVAQAAHAAPRWTPRDGGGPRPAGTCGPAVGPAARGRHPSRARIGSRRDGGADAARPRRSPCMRVAPTRTMAAVRRASPGPVPARTGAKVVSSGLTASVQESFTRRATVARIGSVHRG